MNIIVRPVRRRFRYECFDCGFELETYQERDECPECWSVEDWELMQ